MIRKEAAKVHFSQAPTFGQHESEVDGRPAPKIIDFGVAKALSHQGRRAGLQHFGDRRMAYRASWKAASQVLSKPFFFCAVFI